MSGIRSFVKGRYSDKSAIHIAVNDVKICQQLGDRQRLYTPSGKHTPLAQLMGLAKRNHAYRQGLPVTSISSSDIEV